MGLEPIRAELNDFAKLEILREEEEALSGELAAVEHQIREKLLAVERARYLASLAPYYAARAGQAGAAPDVGQLEATRAQLSQAVEVVRAQRQRLEEALGHPAPGKGGRARRPAAQSAAATRRGGRFDTFEDFRQNQTGEAVPPQK